MSAEREGPSQPATRKGAADEDLSEFREIFNLVDRDGSGTITKIELGELLDTLGIDASPDEVDMMIHEIDEDNNGEIDFEEFVAVMSRKVNATYTSEQVKNAFKVFADTSTPGTISVDALVDALVKYGSTKISDEQARELVSQLEPDAAGLVRFNEYVDMMMNE